MFGRFKNMKYTFTTFLKEITREKARAFFYGLFRDDIVTTVTQTMHALEKQREQERRDAFTSFIAEQRQASLPKEKLN